MSPDQGQSEGLHNGTEVLTIPNGISHEYRPIPDLDGISDRMSRCRNICSKYFPIFTWFRQYRAEMLLGDFMAGLSVAVTAIPQTMAYGLLAGLKPENGLYSAFIPPLLYIILGGCRQVTIGPTAIVSLLAYEICGPEFPECIALSAFYSGVFEVLLSLFRLGWIVSLISDPVIHGFTGGAAIAISSSQVKSFLGYAAPSGRGFTNYWKSAFANITYANIPDVTLGSCCLCLLVFLQKLNFKLAETSRYEPLIRNTQLALQTSKNVIVVLGSTLVAYFSGLGFSLTGDVTPGLPNPTTPTFSLPIRQNDTFVDRDHFYSFTESLGYLGAGPLLIGLIAILQNVAINKLYGTGQKINGNQEILALGVSGIVGGFFSAQPVSASFTRSAINDKSGVKSPLSGLFAGLLLIFALTFFTKGFSYIPRASLAAVIIVSVMSMIDFKVIFGIWNIKKLDLIPFMSTFVVSVFYGMEYGIAAGVTLSILLYLFPHVTSPMEYEAKYMQSANLEYLLLSPCQGFQFPNVDKLREYITEYSSKYSTSSLIKIFVLDCKNWIDYDYTGIASLVDHVKTLRKTGQYLVLLNIDCNRWGPILQKGGLTTDELNKILCSNDFELEALLRTFNTMV